jgi:hypothetical protein
MRSSNRRHGSRHQAQSIDYAAARSGLGKGLRITADSASWAVCGAQHIAHFERRLIAERTKDGIAAARARGKRPGRQPLDADKVAAAIKLVTAGLSPTAAAKQLGLGRSTVYREVSRTGIGRPSQPA